jgi:DNA-directed RNA polymerase specialized sigma24 family protein
MGFELFAALEREWQVVAVSSEADAALQSWATDPVLGDMRGVGEILERTRPGTDRASADSVLGALLRRAPRDDVAARAALQALSPGLINVARRMGAARDPDVAAEVVTVALARIKCYPYERRPRAIAANVVLDVLHALWQDRASAGREMATPAEELHRVAEPERAERIRPNAREVLEVAASSGRLPAEQLQLVFDAVLDRMPLSTAAAEAGISIKAMTRRRERARATVIRAYHAERSTTAPAERTATASIGAARHSPGRHAARMLPAVAPDLG